MRTAIVTGAARGNGFGIAECLAEAGYDVRLLSRGDNVFAAADALKKLGFRTTGYRCEVGDDLFAMRKTVDAILDVTGGVDVLVNNAGLSKVAGFEDLSVTDLDELYRVNVKGTFLMTKLVIPSMKKKHFGRIINLSSVTGPIVCNPGYTGYGTMKAALVGFTKALAVEAAPYGITVNAICPGYIRTPAVERSARTVNPENPESVFAGMAEGIPEGRLGKPEDVGTLAAFLASEGAGYLTGTVTVIDGGETLPETRNFRDFYNAV